MAGTRVWAPGEAAPPVIAVALISAAALAHEILLMQLLSIIPRHRFAYMIISLALLGMRSRPRERGINPCPWL
jgi:hypothetical protein